MLTRRWCVCLRRCVQVCAPIDTTQLGLDIKRDAEGWQQLYDGIKDTSEWRHDRRLFACARQLLGT